MPSFVANNVSGSVGVKVVHVVQSMHFMMYTMPCTVRTTCIGVCRRCMLVSVAATDAARWQYAMGASRRNPRHSLADVIALPGTAAKTANVRPGMITSKPAQRQQHVHQEHQPQLSWHFSLARALARRAVKFQKLLSASQLLSTTSASITAPKTPTSPMC